MADDLNLLFRLRGDATGAKAAANDARQAISQLRQSATTDLKQIQTASTSSLGSITQAAGQIGTQLPLVGTAVSNLSTTFSSLSTASAGAKTNVGGIAAAAVLAVGALGSLASGATEAVRGFFDLARSAAEFQGKLFDLSQQTGVAVETLSALEIEARKTGGSIEQVAASLGIFQKNMEAAGDENSKTAKTFEELGVEVTDTEETLRSTLTALFRLGEGSRQTALALELFGRGGKTLLAILKETNGDLDATIDKLRGFGLVTGAQAKAADEFNDQLVLLSVALRGLGTEAIPPLTDALKTLQATIDANREGFKAIQSVVGFLAGSLGLQLTTAVKVAESVWKSHRTEIDLVVEAYQILRTAIKGAVDEIPKQALPTTGAQSGIELLRELQRFGAGRQLTPKQDFSKIKDLFLPDPAKVAAEAERRRAEAEARAARSLQLQQEALEERTREHRQALERERELDLKSIDEWAQESSRIANEHLTTQTRLLDQESANVQRFVKSDEDRLLAQTDIQQRRTQLINRTTEELLRIETEAQRRRDQSALNVERQLASIREAEREGEIRRIEAALERQAITEAEAITRRLALEKQAFEDRKLLRDEELKQQTTSTERRTELINQQIEDDQRFTDQTRQGVEERNQAREREVAGGAPQGVKGGIVDLSSLGIPPEAEESIRNLNEALVQLGESLGSLVGAGKDFGEQFGQVVGSAIADMAFAVGDLVHQWVLLGDTGPGAMRKLTASVLAGLAAQAAVKAIFQLAEGFAALFFNPAEAAAHFTSAALFGSIAGAAAIAGRAIAGDAFKQKTGAGGLGAGAGSPQALQTIIQGRNQRQGIDVHVTVDDNKFGIGVTTTVANDFNSGGITREVITADGR